MRISKRRHWVAASRKNGPLASKTRRGPRPRQLLAELLEDRRMLADAPMLVDLQPASDSGLYADDNLTNIRTGVIDITAAQAGDTIRVYRGSTLLGSAIQVVDTLYQYTFTAGQLLEGANTITARSFDGMAESGDSPSLVITLDTAGPRITASTPSSLVNLRTATLDSITVTFDEAIDFAPGGGTFTADDVSITGPPARSRRRASPWSAATSTACPSPLRRRAARTASRSAPTSPTWPAT